MPGAQWTLSKLVLVGGMDWLLENEEGSRMTSWFLAYPLGGRVVPLMVLENGSKVPWGGQDEGGRFVFAHVPLKAFTGAFHTERWPELRGSSVPGRYQGREGAHQR